MSMNRAGRLRRVAQAGFNLVELMVASAIGLLIMLAVLTLYLNVSRTNEEMARTNALVENGRFAIRLLQGDLLHAGFWGGYVPEFDDLTSKDIPNGYPPAAPSTAADVPPLCTAYAPWTANYTQQVLSTPVQVYGAVPADCVTANSKVAASRYTNAAKSVTPAIIAVRHAETCEAKTGSATCPLNYDSDLYLQVSRCFKGTSTTVALDTQPYVLSNVQADFVLKNLDCTTDTPTAAPLRRYISNVYYVRDYSVTPGDGLPTLVRNAFTVKDGVLEYQAAEPLIEGVEDLRIELGIDNVSKSGESVNYEAAVLWADSLNKTTARNRGDGVADEFVTCPDDGCTALQLVGAVSAKVHVLVRSLQPTPGYTDTKSYQLGAVTVGPFNDGFKRHVFSSYVRFNNISARRETP